MKGVIVSLYKGGYGFVKPLANQADPCSAAIGSGYFYHLDDSPNMPDVVHDWREVVGVVVDFELVQTPADWRSRAINLTPVPKPKAILKEFAGSTGNKSAEGA